MLLHNLLAATSRFISDAYDYLAVLYLLRAVISFFELQIHNVPVIPVYIDNQGLLTRLDYGEETCIKHCQRTGADITRETLFVKNTLPIIFNRHHVKSHQYDNVSDSDDIPYPNRLNKQCDRAAEEAYTTL